MWGGEFIKYDRNLLYEQVWADPVQTVAKSYGVSGVYLARICRQLSVPLPPRGYWAKVHAGKSPHRARLPKLKKGEKETLAVWHRFTPRRADVDPGTKLELPTDVVVADELTAPHRLVARTAKRLARAKPSDGTVSGRPLGLLDVTVGPDSLDRAMRIYDALLKGMETIGLRVEITGPSELKRDEWGRHLRNPRQAEHRFHAKPNRHSTASRTPTHGKANSDSTPSRTLSRLAVESLTGP